MVGYSVYFMYFSVCAIFIISSLIPFFFLSSMLTSLLTVVLLFKMLLIYFSQGYLYHGLP